MKDILIKLKLIDYLNIDLLISKELFIGNLMQFLIKMGICFLRLFQKVRMNIAVK